MQLFLVAAFLLSAVAALVSVALINIVIYPSKSSKVNTSNKAGES